MRNRHGRINKPKKIIRNVTHEPHDQEGKLTLFWSLSNKKKKKKNTYSRQVMNTLRAKERETDAEMVKRLSISNEVLKQGN